MKSIINGEQKSEFPKIMLNQRNGLIVLFEESSAGTVLHDDTETYTIGHHSTNWDELVFVNFTGSITLSND